MLTRTWLALVALSLTSALMTLLQLDRPLAGAVILLLALLKSRLILSNYLGLAQAPHWRRGFNFTLTAFCTLILGLYMV